MFLIHIQIGSWYNILCLAVLSDLTSQVLSYNIIWFSLPKLVLGQLTKQLFLQRTTILWTYSALVNPTISKVIFSTTIYLLSISFLEISKASYRKFFTFLVNPTLSLSQLVFYIYGVSNSTSLLTSSLGSSQLHILSLLLPRFLLVIISINVCLSTLLFSYFLWIFLICSWCFYQYGFGAYVVN